MSDKYLDLPGLQRYHNLAKEHFVAKEAGKGLSKNDFTDEYKKMIDDLAYVPIAINTFTNNINTVEMGSTVTEVVLNWTYNKTPKVASLDAEQIDVNLKTKTLTGQNIKTNKTFTLSATDERDKTVKKTTAISFLNGVYWGVGVAAPTLNSAFILSLTKGLQGSRTKTFTVNAGAGQHIYYAIPTRYGAAAFNVGGFDGGFTKAGTIEFTNGSGYKENYDIYKSDNANLGNTTVKVS